MRKGVREFIRRLETAGLTVESTPGHYRVLREGKPLRKQSGMPLMLPFSPDTFADAGLEGRARFVYHELSGCRVRSATVERLWNGAVATSGNRWKPR